MAQSKKEEKTNKSPPLVNLFCSYFSNKSVEQIFKAGIYSLDGLKILLSERAFVQELFLFIILLPFAFYLANTSIELVLLIVSIAFVLLVEAVNTSIEATIDRIGNEIHPLAKKAKDICSFCVLFSIIIAIFVWLVIGFF